MLHQKQKKDEMMKETLYSACQMAATAEAPMQVPAHYYCQKHTPPVFLTIAVWTGIFALIGFLVW